MANADKLRYEQDLIKIAESKQERKKVKPEIEKCSLDGMPKRPLSAYMLFAKDIRAILKKKMPLCSFSDVMKAVSMDWVKLSKEKKLEYY
jgi:hypothetical protein